MRVALAEGATTINLPDTVGANSLLAGPNLGGGSSREHASWALWEFGFVVILAESFADIFAQSCVQNGRLAGVVAASAMQTLFARAAAGPHELTADLEQCEVRDADGYRTSFAISDFRRTMLLAGLDEIGRMRSLEAEIRAFEQRRDAELQGVME